MIVVTGAAGKTGRAVIQTLARRGAAVRAIVRRGEQIETALADGATEAIQADLRDLSALRAAMRPALRTPSTLYLICPNVQPDEPEICRGAIAVAREAGLTRVVYHSVLHPQTEAMPHHWNKLRVEEHLFQSGLGYTILQPAAYFQNLLGGWDQVVGEGAYRVPYAASTKLGMVDLRDVAEAAATVLTEPDHAGATYELCGPEVHDQHEVAAAFSQALRREVRVEETPVQQWAEQARRAGLGEYQVTTLCQMFQYYEQYGFWGSPRVLTWLLGRAPTPLASFLERTTEEATTEEETTEEIGDTI